MQRLIEQWIIFLKEDLKIADICHSARENILSTITNEEYFSPELISYFTKIDPSKPYIISESEPPQVVVFKKLMNALDHSEKALRAVENLDINRDRYLLGIGKDALQLSFKAINEVYAALQLINHSNADIQRIVGPHLKTLLPQFALATKAMGQFAPEHPEEGVGAVLGEAIEMLPTEKITKEKGLENLGEFLFSLPQEFEKLHKLIAKGSAGAGPASITTTDAYQADMRKRSRKLDKAFNKLCNKHLAVTVTGMRRYVTIIRELGAQTTNLFNTAAPLTKEAYLASAKILENIKHNILPDLISELEQAEESLGLKPGILTKPVLKQVNQFYSQLAEQVNFIGKIDTDLDKNARFLMKTALGKTAKAVTGVKKVNIGKEIDHFSNLKVMIDDAFVERRRANQINRLSAAIVDAENNNPLQAANKFFEQLDSYWSSSYYVGSLANISEKDKKILITQYKPFQHHFAALHPQLDQMIVDQLQKKTPGFMYYEHSENKINQFTLVSQCQESVKSRITQSQEQAKLKAKLVQNTMSQAEQTTYITPNLNHSVLPFKPHPMPAELEPATDKLVEHYHQQAITVNNEVKQLEIAKQGMEEFFDYLDKKYPTSDPSFATLDEEDKRFLSTAFIKFQSQFLTLKDVSIDKHKIDIEHVNMQLVNSLTSSTPTDPPLLLSNLKSIQPQLNSTLTSLIINSKENKKAYLELEIAARDQEPLVAKGAELGEKTLFGQINELKLSKKVDDFLNTKFKIYLQNNLSPQVFKQLDFEKVPFLEFHKDSPEVKMYKQLINSLYYLKNGLDKLESVTDYGDTTWRYEQSRFIYNTMNALLMNISFSKYYLMEAAANPGLKDILQEGLELLAPLKNIPVIGDYLNTSEKPALTPTPVKIDIIAAWKAQQTVVRSGLTPVQDKPKSKPTVALTPPSPSSEISPTPVSVITEPATLEKPKETNYVQLIAEQLYQIPDALNKLKPTAEPPTPAQEALHKKITDKKIKEFIDSLSGLSFGASTGQKVLNAIQIAQIQISDIAKQGRELTMSNLKEIKSALGAPLIIAADNAEFQLGLKPGTYSKVISDRVDNFFSTLLVNLPIEEDAIALDSILSTETLEKRKAHEIARLALIDENPVDTRKSVFGTDYEQFNQLFQGRIPIKAIANKVVAAEVAPKKEHMEDHHTVQPTLLAIKDEFVQAYEKIQPLLFKFNSQFTPDYISSCDEDSLLTKKMAQILKFQPPPSGSFAKLKALYLINDFDNTDHKKEFIKCYKELQPYLNQMDQNYDPDHFLKGLKSSAHFEKALEKIINEESNLNGLLQDLEKAYVSPEDIKKTIFGTDNKQLNEVFKDGLAIKFTADIARDNAAAVDILDLKNDLLQPYENMQSLLIKMDPQFTTDYISSCNDNALLNKKVAEILKFYFLKCYQELQPYLNQIDYSYDCAYFLRELQTPEDFGTALEKIIKEESKLRELIQGLEKSKDLKKDLCRERIHYFELAIREQESGIGYEKIQEYKEKAFNNYLKKTLKADLIEQFGTSAELIYPFIEPILVEKKAAIFASGEIKKNLVEETEIFLKDNIEVIKGIVFYNYINTSVKNALSQELGVYAEPFLEQIASKIEPKKAAILEDIPLDKIRTKITERIDGVMPELIDNNMRIKNAYIDLNKTMKKIVNLLAAEQAKPKGNPCRDEKIILLQAKLDQLQNIKPPIILQNLIILDIDVKKALKSYRNTDDLISIYETLVLLNASANNKEISALMEQLANTQEDVASRLNKARNGMEKLTNPQLLDDYEKINKVSSHLNIMLIQIKGLLKEEKSNLAHDSENPCRLEKIALLESLMATLLDTDHIPKGDAALAFLQKRSTKIANQLITLPHYNQLIDLYVKLGKIQTYIEKLDEPPELKKKKTKEISKMQTMLAPEKEPKKEALARLKEVKAYGLSDECQKTVFQDSDFSIVKALKSFFKALVNIWKKDEGKDKDKDDEDIVSSFKQKLNEMKLDTQESVKKVAIEGP